MDFSLKMKELSDLDKSILEKAFIEFSQKGYYRANMDVVADALKIGKGTLYRHFKSKALLFVAVLIDLFQKASKNLDGILDIEDDLMAFDQFIDRIVIATEKGHLMKNSFSHLELDFLKQEMESGDDLKQIGLYMKKMRADMLAVLVKVLERGARNGIFRKGLPLPLTAEIILTTMVSLRMSSDCPELGHKAKGNFEKDLNEIKQFILRSIVNEKK